MNKAQDILLGLAIGDALGVPVEFKPRSYFEQYPVTDMQGYGTHNQKHGTWSDDSSLAFCLAESLIIGYDLADISKRFIQWLESAYWTAHGVVFDCGITTGRAIDDLRQIIADQDYGRFKTLIDEGDEYSNGNGSLMRIAPLLFHIKGMDMTSQFEIVKAVSALTHRHVRSAIACLVYLKWMEFVLDGKDKVAAYQETQKVINQFLPKVGIRAQERSHFARLLEHNIAELDRSQIRSSGYVMHSLEASFWCVLTTNTYKDAVLKAVNLGEDTDTTGAITGAIAGLLYGTDSIPQHWLVLLARVDDIKDLAKRLSQK